MRYVDILLKSINFNHPQHNRSQTLRLPTYTVQNEEFTIYCLQKNSKITFITLCYISMI